jgi:hypothetical protein
MIVSARRFAQYQASRHAWSYGQERRRGEPQQANFAVPRDARQYVTRAKGPDLPAQEFRPLRRQCFKIHEAAPEDLGRNPHQHGVDFR